jgi:immune inhibitor A
LALVLLVAPTAAGAVSAADGSGGAPAAKSDNRPDPLTTAQGLLKEKAIEAKLAGKAPGKVKRVAKGQYVELAREGSDPVWTLLGEFSDVKHNQIPQPDRRYDNTTIWQPDFSRDFFNKMLYDQTKGANSMANYYIEQSSNRYTVTGDTQGWVEAEGSEADYGANKPNGDDIDPWGFIKSSLNDWYAKQVAAGKTDAEINAYLQKFDVWDRYDYDLDGEFNEADGYIDRFQMVHAGEDEAAGAGDNKIWSHSWYAYYQDIGTTGPDFNKFGGIQIGDRDFWVGK